jgi:hypothetical protein
MPVFQSAPPMSTLTAILSYLGWHISIMVLSVIVCTFWAGDTARHSFWGNAECENHARKSRKEIVLQRLLFPGVTILIPTLLVGAAFCYTGYIHPNRWIIAMSAKIGWYEYGILLTLCGMNYLSRKWGRCCCGGVHSRRRRPGPGPRRLSEVPMEP